MSARHILAVAATLAAVGSSPVSANDFRLGHTVELTHPVHLAAVEAADAFKSCTGGRHGISIFPASQLGSENSQNQLVRSGGIDLVLTGGGFQYNVYKPMAITGAPFIFKDQEQALRFRTSDLYHELWQGYEKQTGQTIMSAGYFGAFNITSNAPLEKPEDMKGVKIRVPDTPIYLAFPRAVGANAAPIALAEVYLALQNGTVSGSANPLPMTYAFKFYEVQKYVNPTAHMREYMLWIANGAMLKSLAPADRDCMQKAADLFAEKTTQLIIEQEANLRSKMEADNLIKFSNPDIPAFQAATRNVVDELAKSLGVPPDFMTRLRAL
jgi:tripartite ATP-independent transporter DctP family solute receptor